MHFGGGKKKGELEIRDISGHSTFNFAIFGRNCDGLLRLRPIAERMQNKITPFSCQSRARAVNSCIHVAAKGISKFEQEAQGRHKSGHRLKRKGAGSKSRITRVGGARGSASRRTCAGVGVGVHSGTDRVPRSRTKGWSIRPF